MKQFNLEVTVGLFVLLGLGALAYLSINLGQIQLGQGSTYELSATFPTVTGLRLGATVEIAGVSVGRVHAIRLAEYSAVVTLRIANQVTLQEDAIVSIRTRGLIGDKYVKIAPGGSERLLKAGGRIREVEPPVDFETLIGHFIQGKL